MKPIEMHVPWLPGHILAVTLWPFILYRAWSPCTRVHEHYHWHQARRWGVIPWYIVYLTIGLFYVGKPASDHPMEREAYRLQRGCEDAMGQA